MSFSSLFLRSLFHPKISNTQKLNQELFAESNFLYRKKWLMQKVKHFPHFCNFCDTRKNPHGYTVTVTYKCNRITCCTNFNITYKCNITSQRKLYQLQHYSAYTSYNIINITWLWHPVWNTYLYSSFRVLLVVSTCKHNN